MKHGGSEPHPGSPLANHLGCSEAFVALHAGAHICIDSEPHDGLCLITDPAREAECLALLTPPGRTTP